MSISYNKLLPFNFAPDCANEEHKDIGCLPYACVYCQLERHARLEELQEQLNIAHTSLTQSLTTQLYGGMLTSSTNAGLIVNITGDIE